MKMMNADGARLAEILLVEDNEQDVILTRRGFDRAKLKVNLHHVENGEECMAFLRRTGEYADVPEPDLIILDLNMPVMDGREVLAEMTSDERLRHIPVVVLTTSSDEQDVLEMYKMRCSAYTTKPVTFDKFLKVIEGIADFWFTVVVLPPKNSRA